MNYVQMSLYDTANGEGIRTTLWVSGCSHHCKECHNPKTWDKNYGIEFTSNDLKYLIQSIDNEHISGVTLSGGDPLFKSNVDTVECICEMVKRKLPSKTVWMYTGYLWEDVCDLPLMKFVDVLVDGEFDISKKDVSLPFCGSSNQRVIDVQKSLQNRNKDAVLYIKK